MYQRAHHERQLRARANTAARNPHQVSTHGTLLLKGIGLASGMAVAFPKAPGARISSVSPGIAHLRKTSAGLS